MYQSWRNKNQGKSNAKLTFDKVSKKRATDCTPAGARIEVNAVKSKDPVTKKDVYTGLPAGYTYTKDDDAHSCGDPKPSLSVSTTASGSITITANRGKFDIDTVTASVNGSSISLSRSGDVFQGTYADGDPSGKVHVTVTDTGYYTNEGTF